MADDERDSWSLMYYGFRNFQGVLDNWFHEQAGQTYPTIHSLAYHFVGEEGLDGAFFSAFVESTANPSGDCFRISFKGRYLLDYVLPQRNISLVNVALDCLCGDERGDYANFRETLPPEVVKKVADPLQETLLRLLEQG